MIDMIEIATKSFHIALNEIGDPRIAIGGFGARAHHQAAVRELIDGSEYFHTHDLAFPEERTLAVWLSASERFSTIDSKTMRDSHGYAFKPGLSRTVWRNAPNSH